MASLVIGLQEEMKARPTLLPIIHISAHGGLDGLELSSKESISWNELRDLLLPINEALSGGLLLCMSSCEGFAACKMAMNETRNQPFLGVIGNYGKPTWSDTAIAYASFYQRSCYTRSCERNEYCIWSQKLEHDDCPRSTNLVYSIYQNHKPSRGSAGVRTER